MTSSQEAVNITLSISHSGVKFCRSNNNVSNQGTGSIVVVAAVAAAAAACARKSNVIIGVRLSVCLSVSNFAKTTERIFIKILPHMYL